MKTSASLIRFLVMTAISTITIADGQATPVNHTYQPITSSPAALYRENVAGVGLAGQPVITLTALTSPEASLQKVRIELKLPAMEVVTGQNSSGYSAAPKVAYTVKATLDVFLPARSTSAQRKDLRVLLRNLLTDAQVVDVIDNLNMPY